MSSYLFKVGELEKYRHFLENILKSNHAIILNSQDTMLLDILAKLYVAKCECKNSNAPCLYCENCQKIIDNNALDISYFGVDKNIVVEDSEKIVLESFVVPYEFKNKYFVLKNFDFATAQAQNKLLKIIEEPQKFDKFILLCSNLDNVLSTIKSRCEIFDVPRFDDNELKQIFDFDIGNAKKVSFGAEYAGGNLTKLSMCYEDEEFEDIYKLALKVITNMQSSANVLEYSSQILKYREKIEIFLEILSNFYRDILVLKQNDKMFVQNKESANVLIVMSKSISSQALVKIIQEIQSEKQKIKFNANISMLVDDLLLKILEIKHLCK